MSDGTHLWDDSALLNAFNDAVSKYKIMHGKDQQPDRSKDGEKSLKNSNELPEQSHRPGEGEEILENSKAQSDHSKEGEKILSSEDCGTVLDLSDKGVVSHSTDGGEANDLQSVQENLHTDSHAPELHKDTTSDPHLEETLEGYANFEGVGEYNQLLNQYYKLEEQRQKVLLELQQKGYWNNQYSGEGSGTCLPGGICSTQEHQNSSDQFAQPAFSSACCPYACHSLVIPCSMMPACPLGESGACKVCVDASPIACPLVKTASGAAEKALSSMKLITSGTSIMHEEGGKTAGSVEPETDLSVVLSAWYSAGFHTGKYLSEQSAKRRLE